jgi:hypothetical protein
MPRPIVFDIEKRVFSSSTIDSLLNNFVERHVLVKVVKRKGTATFSEMFRGTLKKEGQRDFLINGPFGEINVTNLILFSSSDDPSVARVEVEEILTPDKIY